MLFNLMPEEVCQQFFPTWTCEGSWIQSQGSFSHTHGRMALAEVVLINTYIGQQRRLRMLEYRGPK